MILKGKIQSIHNYSGQCVMRIASDEDWEKRNFEFLTLRLDLTERQKEAYRLGRQVTVKLETCK